MSEFWFILLLILKIIGITLVTILGIIILIVLLILLWPIKYHLKFDISSGKYLIYAKASWMSLVKVIFEKKDKISLSVKLLFFEIYGSDKAKKNTYKEPEPKINNSYEKQSNENHHKSDQISEDSINENNASSIDLSEESLDDNSKSSFSELEEDKHDKKETNTESKQDKISNEKKNTHSNSFYDKIKRKIKVIQSDEFKISFDKVKHKLILLIKMLLPHKWKIKAIVGFDDPATTGKVLAISGICYGLFPGHLDVSGDFDNEIIEVKSYAIGYISIIKLLIIIFQLYFDKKIRKIVKRLKEA